MRLYNQLVDNALVVLKKDGQGSWVQVPPAAPLIQVPPTKSHSFIGWFFAARVRARGSDFCEKLTFRENFSQKNFLKKFLKFPENHLTIAYKYDII